MSKKSGPAPPPPPDPYATAAAQSQTNQQTATANAELNRYNQYTPYGNSVYAVTGHNADGTPIYSQTTTLSAAGQQQLSLQNKLATSLLGTAGSQLGRVDTTMKTPFNFNGAPAQVGGINLNSLPSMISNVDPTGTQRTVAGAGDIQTGLGPNDPIQSSLNFGNAPNLPGVGDFSADRNSVTDALYNQAKSRLDPQFDQRKSDLAAALSNQGIAEGSDAYNREIGNFSRDRNDAYDTALNSAIGAGGSEQSRIFGLALNARQQAVGEDQTQGQFTNDAQAQKFAQALGGGTFANSAQAQQYDQNANNASFYNASGESQFQQMLARAGVANQANQQSYTEQQGNATLQNQARQQYETEQSYLRNLPLQDVATLMGTAGSPQSPTFQPVQNVSQSGTDLGGMVYDSYNARFNNYQAQQQQSANAKGQMFGALGSGAGAVAMSDRRLKHSIEQIDTLYNGVKTYVFSYLGETRRRFGVMADEVMHIPGAVLTGPNGYMLVDYGKVW